MLLRVFICLKLQSRLYFRCIFIFIYVAFSLQRKKEPCLRTTLFYCLLSLSYQWYFSPLLILKAR